jgi:hypothetical protein
VIQLPVSDGQKAHTAVLRIRPVSIRVRLGAPKGSSDGSYWTAGLIMSHPFIDIPKLTRVLALVVAVPAIVGGDIVRLAGLDRVDDVKWF